MDNTFGHLLRRHRLAAGFTQESLAERAKLSSQAIGSLERGDRKRPYKYTVDVLADALGLDEVARSELRVAARPSGRPRPGPADAEAGAAGDRVTPVASCDADGNRTAHAAQPADGAVEPESAGCPPRQLPAPPPRFTGRDGELAALVAALTRDGGVPVCAVTGMGGVGKTALALHAAHAVAEQFPDGQVYLDLRSHDKPLDTRAALSQLLRAVGGVVDAVDGTDAVGAYRSVLAGRRLLLVLDNVSGPQQVADLLPGATGCAAIVTSRHALDTLPHTLHTRLDVLTEDASLTLLTDTIGAERLAAEPEAARELAGYCGGLPLALHLAGSRLAVRPQWPIAHLAERLADRVRRLDELERRELGVRACFAVSFELLDAADRRRYALLGVLPAGGLSVELTARLLATTETAAEAGRERPADLSPRDAEAMLERFTDLALLDAHEPGVYRMHDLLHAYAREQAERLLEPEERAGAVRRAAELFTAVAWRSLNLAQPNGIRRDWSGGVDLGVAPEFVTSAAAFAWLDAHRAQLVEIVSQPGMPPETTVRLSIGLFAYYLSRGYLLDWATIAEAAATAAETGTDPLITAVTKMDSGMARCDLAAMWSADPSDGVDQMYRGLKEFQETGEREATAVCLINMAATFTRIDRLDAAGDCAEDALRLCRDVLGSRAGQAAAAFNLGTVAGRLGDFDRELSLYRESLGLVGAEDQLARAEMLRGIGGAQRRGGDNEAATATLREALAASEAAGDLAGRAVALEELGRTLLACGDPGAAAEPLRDGLDVAVGIGDAIRADRIRRLLADLDELGSADPGAAVG
ncbi:XRE family transcriptional regulator [Stackebrandtia nassauensis]|uniref:Transcriptional regulator, XRE family n=1 Tax=Stackebrandtia nassauensis (strain DSM 44728 / CIP 108903 / NRRL B-16338 / NBRC 102104 / LLR-40K-21) TaxID=446470 RepID=D3PUP6_STANL|nr:XRE family transcriptional regulator [Stackebrandtia nassauensis]ADD44920.1 transcriptional regulator, XRE family [Stackebrandtia nassauensis DSM 44728]